MTTSAELIVLNHTPFGENAIVLHTLSREHGRRGFLVRVGKGGPMALFLPLSLIEADITDNPRSQLWSARRITSRHPLAGIRGNLYKNTMTLFMSEVLYRVLRDGAREEGLYEWCERSLLTLDALEDNFSNFPVRFLIELAAALGFRPAPADLAPFADTRLDTLQRLSAASFEEAMLIPLTGAERNTLAEDLVRYLEFHTESALHIRSLGVLRELYR